MINCSYANTSWLRLQTTDLGIGGASEGPWLQRWHGNTEANFLSRLLHLHLLKPQYSAVPMMQPKCWMSEEPDTLLLSSCLEMISPVLHLSEHKKSRSNCPVHITVTKTKAKAQTFIPLLTSIQK